MADKDSVIIKKVKKGGHGGHHGGAWKVAYADFVTAMMAFFLLLWLLNTASKDKLKGIAEYFTPTIGLKDQMGIGFQGGISSQEEGDKKNDSSQNAVVFGVPTKGQMINTKKHIDTQNDTMDQQNFTNIENDLYKAIHENPELNQFKEKVVIDETPEGLRIQVLDNEKRPMFEPSTAILQSYVLSLLNKITQLIKYVPNYIAIAGHTNSVKPNGIGIAEDNWILSAARANSTRVFMVQSGLDKEQVARVEGKADQEPFDIKDPDSPRNIRLSIILLRNSILPHQKKSAPDSLTVQESDFNNTDLNNN